MKPVMNLPRESFDEFAPSPPLPGDTSLYKLDRYVRPQRLWFSSCFSLSIDFYHFWSEIGYGLCNMVWNWVWFLEEATFLLLSSIEKCVFSSKNRKSETVLKCPQKQ